MFCWLINMFRFVFIVIKVRIWCFSEECFVLFDKILCIDIGDRVDGDVYDV